MLSAEEVVKSYKGIGACLVQDNNLSGVELVPFYDAEDCIVSMDTLGGEFLVLEVVCSLIVEADVLGVRFLVVLGEEEPVDDVLRPGRAEVVDVSLGGLLADSCNDAVNLSLRSTGLSDLRRFLSDIDHDLPLDEVFGENVRMRACALRNLPGVAVPEQDLGLAGVLVLDGGEGEGY